MADAKRSNEPHLLSSECFVFRLFKSISLPVTNTFAKRSIPNLRILHGSLDNRRSIEKYENDERATRRERVYVNGNFIAVSRCPRISASREILRPSSRNQLATRARQQRLLQYCWNVRDLLVRLSIANRLT